MARALKDGLDYFPLDVTFFSDIDTRIIRSRYGSDGIIVYLFLKCEIFRKGYYIKIDDDFLCLMSDELNISESLIKQVLNFLLKRSLFNSKLFESDKVLTSAHIQKQYQLSKKSAGTKRDIVVKPKLWLLKNFENESFIKMHPSENISEKNNDYSEKNNDFSENNSQSKVKESKVKESKVNENISPIIRRNAVDFQLLNRIVYLYNYICSELPEVEITADKITAIQSLIGKGVTVEEIAEAFRLANSSDFLTGKSSKTFKASFEWIIKHENYQKIIEYKYNKQEQNEESYDINEFSKYAIGYKVPDRQKLPGFCKDCPNKNPYKCICNCMKEEWSEMTSSASIALSRVI